MAFSTPPFCQGACGAQKKVSMPKAWSRWWLKEAGRPPRRPRPPRLPLGPRQGVAPGAARFSAGGLGRAEALDGLVGDDGVARLASQPAGDLLRRPAVFEPGEHRRPARGIAGQAGAAPAPRAGLPAHTAAGSPVGGSDCVSTRAQWSLARDPELQRFAGASTLGRIIGPVHTGLQY